MTAPTRSELDAQAIAFEHAAEVAVTAAFASEVAAASAQVAAWFAAGVTGATLVTALAQHAYGKVVPSMAGPAAGRASAGVDLGRAQAGKPTRVGLPPDRELHNVVRNVDTRAAQRLTEAVRLARSLSMQTQDDVASVVSRAHMAVTGARSDVRWIATRAISAGVAQVADELGWHVLWVPERNACLQCLAYAGLVTRPWDDFPAGLTFADAPSTLSAVPYPPLHPHCRCRIEPYNGPPPKADRSDMSPASELAREARRSVVKGWSSYDSERARISAADRLIRRGAELPPTVVKTALRAIERGAFFDHTRRPR